MTLKMPWIDKNPRGIKYSSGDRNRFEHSIAIEYDTSGNQQFYLVQDEVVKYGPAIGTAGAREYASAIPPTTLPATEIGHRYVLLMSSSGAFLVCDESQLTALDTGTDEYYPMYRQTARGWVRWQPVAVPVVIPCLGINPKIVIVAGANAWGVSTDTTNGTVDGPLGTGLMNNPHGGVFGPDGKYYFIDDGTPHIRYFDPATGNLGTTIVSLDRGTGLFYRENSQVFALGPDGRFYFFLNQTDDNNTPIITSANADNTDGSFTYLQDGVIQDLAQISNPFVAPDNSGLYVPCPQSTPYTGITGSGGQPYTVLKLGISSVDGSCSSHSTYAGDPTILGIPSLRSGYPGPNAQGENVDAGSGEVGNTVNCYCDPVGNLYTLCNQTRMLRRIDKSTHKIVSIANHVPLDSSGAIQAGGYSGDGSAAFTFGDNTAQFGRFGFNSVTVDPCDNVFVNDLQFGYGSPGSVGQSSLVRYVDLSGILHTFVGQVPDVDNTLPSTTPQDATSVTIYRAQWIAWGPDGALYITSSYFDGANISENAIYKVTTSH